MIKYHNKILVIEVPRTGTTTLRDCTEGYDEMNCPRHISISDYLKTFPQYQNLLTVSFIRNPYDRFTSLYEHTKHFNRHQPATSSFKMFTDWFVNDGSAILTRDNIRQTQFEMLSINGQVKLDWIGRFENYYRDVHKFINDYKILVPESIIITNKFQHKPYQDYYNDQTKNQVASFFEKDLDYFKYTFK